MAKKQFNQRIDEGTIERINYWAQVDAKPKKRPSPAVVVEAAMEMYDRARLGGASEPLAKPDEPAMAVSPTIPDAHVSLAPSARPWSSWMDSELARLQDEYGTDLRGALDMMAEFFKECGGKCADCREREAAATSSVAPSTLPEPGAGPRDCLHCGAQFLGRKGATICGECAGSGHTGDVRECGACNEARAL